MTQSGILNRRMAWVMPMYSVTSVSQLMTARSKIENQPQNLSESVKDGLRVTALGHGAQAHGHLLNVVRHRHQNNKRPEQIESGLRPGLGVGRDAPGVVVGDHRDDARSQRRKKNQRAALKPYDSMNALVDPVHAARMLFYTKVFLKKRVFLTR